MKKKKEKLENGVFYSRSRIRSTNHSDWRKKKDETGGVYVVKTIHFLFFPPVREALNT